VAPFTDGGDAGTRIMTTRWNTLEAMFVRLQTDTGLIGWDECFAYSCRSAVVHRPATGWHRCCWAASCRTHPRP